MNPIEKMTEGFISPQSDSTAGNRSALHLAHIRRLKIDEAALEASERSSRGATYNRAHADIFFPDAQCWSPHPDRVVAKRWKPFPRVVQSYGNESLQREQQEEFGMARVRLLADDHQFTFCGRGSVVEVPLIRYSAYFHAAGTMNHPKAEPVPDDMPLLKLPIVAMSSNFSEARAAAARALKKEPADLSVKDVWAYYRDLKPKAETFHGV